MRPAPNNYTILNEIDGLVVVDIPSLNGSSVSYRAMGKTLDEALESARELRDTNEKQNDD